MTTINGVVGEIGTKTVTTKFGPKPTFSIKVDGEWYKCGFTKPSASAGDNVSFDYIEGSYGKDINMKTFMKSGGGGASASPTTPSSKPAPSYGSKGVFPIPPLDGQRAIVRQNALTNARELYAASKGGKAFELDSKVAQEIVSIARMFEAYACGDLDAKRAEELRAAKTTTPTVEEVMGDA